MGHLLVLAEQLLVHLVHRLPALLRLRLQVVHFTGHALHLDPLLIQLALVLANSNLVILLLFPQQLVEGLLVLCQPSHLRLETTILALPRL